MKTFDKSIIEKKRIPIRILISWWWLFFCHGQGVKSCGNKSAANGPTFWADW